VTFGAETFASISFSGSGEAPAPKATITATLDSPVGAVVAVFVPQATITAILDLPVGAVLSAFILQAEISATLDPPVGAVVAVLVPQATITATLDPPVGAAEALHKIGVTITATLDPPVGAAEAFHDFEQGNLPAGSQRIYTMTLSGNPDLNLPMKSFQATMNTGAASYVSAVIPDPETYAAEIAARNGGTIKIYKGYRLPDGSELLNRIALSVMTEVRYDIGANSASVSLTGYQVIAAGAPKIRTLTGERYQSVTNGKRRIRANVDTFLLPGDYAVTSLGTYRARSITYIIGTEQEQMEVQE